MATCIILGIFISLDPSTLSVSLSNADTCELMGEGRWDAVNQRITDCPSFPRTSAAWWAWHDEDSARWSPDLEDAEEACASWVAGKSDVGPDSDWIYAVLDTTLESAIDHEAEGPFVPTHLITDDGVSFLVMEKHGCAWRRHRWEAMDAPNYSVDGETWSDYYGARCVDDFRAVSLSDVSTALERYAAGSPRHGDSDVWDGWVGSQTPAEATAGGPVDWPAYVLDMARKMAQV